MLAKPCSSAAWFEAYLWTGGWPEISHRGQVTGYPLKRLISYIQGPSSRQSCSTRRPLLWWFGKYLLLYCIFASHATFTKYTRYSVQSHVLTQFFVADSGTSRFLPRPCLQPIRLAEITSISASVTVRNIARHAFVSSDAWTAHDLDSYWRRLSWAAFIAFTVVGLCGIDGEKFQNSWWTFRRSFCFRTLKLNNKLNHSHVSPEDCLY